MTVIPPIEPGAEQPVEPEAAEPVAPAPVAQPAPAALAAPAAPPALAAPPAPAASSERPAAPRWRLPLLTGIGGFVLGVLVVLAVLGVASFATNLVASTAGQNASAATKARFEKAINNCALNQSAVLKVSKDGRQLTIVSAGLQGSNGLSADSVACVLSGLDAPVAVTNSIANGLATQQSLKASWEGLTAVWGTDATGAITAQIVASSTGASS